MGYPQPPGRAIAYHLNGTVVKLVDTQNGVLASLDATQMSELNDYDYDSIAGLPGGLIGTNRIYLVFSFPEPHHLRGLFALWYGRPSVTDWGYLAPTIVEGSNDSTNGLDGTWTQAVPDAGWGNNTDSPAFDAWRYPSSGTFPNDAAFKVWRVRWDGAGYDFEQGGLRICHLYGHPEAGSQSDFLEWVDTGGQPLSLDLIFGAVPAGTSSILGAALVNRSTTKTAQNITITVDDPDDIIRIGWSSNGPWELSLTISSLAPGEQSATIYVKAEPPAPPTPLKPHRAPILASVGAWV